MLVYHCHICKRKQQGKALKRKISNISTRNSGTVPLWEVVSITSGARASSDDKSFIVHLKNGGRQPDVDCQFKNGARNPEYIKVPGVYMNKIYIITFQSFK